MMTPATGRPPRDHRFRQRTYRNRVDTALNCELIRVQQTDLAIYSDRPPVAQQAKQAVLEQRGYLEAYIRRFPGFAAALTPWPEDATAPAIVRTMIRAAGPAGVGPMAAVAGAIASRVGTAVLKTAQAVIVENGGDIFINTRVDTTVALFAGDSPLSMKVGLKVDHADMPCGVCTSSGRVGPSLSFGCADAVCVISPSCAVADAAATAIANRVMSAGDIHSAIDWGATLPKVEAIVIVVADKMGVWGKLEIVPL